MWDISEFENNLKKIGISVILKLFVAIMIFIEYGKLAGALALVYIISDIIDYTK